VGKYHSQTGQLRANQGPRGYAQDFVRRAEEWRDDEAALMAYTAAVIANFLSRSSGSRRVSSRHRSAPATIPGEHGKLVQIYQHDPLIVSLVYSGHIEWLVWVGPPGPESAVRRRGNSRTRSGILSCSHLPPFLAVSDHWYEGDLAANLASVETRPEGR